MSELPDYITIVPNPSDVLSLYRHEFPHTLALLPEFLTLAELIGPKGRSHAIGMFLVEPHSIGEVLNGAALPAYISARVPVLLHAERAKDLRPILRRFESFAARGYRVELVK